MTICHELQCVGCDRKFHATYGEDESIPEKCPICDPPAGGLPPKASSTIDSMSPLIVPDEHDLRDWDAGWS